MRPVKRSPKTASFFVSSLPMGKDLAEVRYSSSLAEPRRADVKNKSPQFFESHVIHMLVPRIC
jgi:hypothetical protein